MFTTGVQSKVITRNDWFTQYVSDSMLAMIGTSNIRTQKRLYPSSAGLCARRNVLSLTKEFANDFGLSGMFYTTIGDAIHGVIQDAIVQRDPNALIEYALKDEYLMLSGRADIIMRDKTTDTPFIVDIKTTGAIPKSPKSDHVRQLAVYAILSGIKDTEIYYVSRNVGNPPKMKGYTIDFRAARYKYVLTEVMTTIARTIVAMNVGELPKRLRYPSKCKFCPFYEDCWDEPHDALLKTSYKEYDEKANLNEEIKIINHITDTMENRYEVIDNLV